MKLFNLNTGVCVAVGVLLLVGTAPAVDIETVTVGNPNNPGELSGEGAGGLGPDRICGSVDYTYKIGKYEVTNAQYCEFLNAVAASDPYNLYDVNTGNVEEEGGITRSGIEGYYTYSTISGRADKPVNWVTFWDACRFANWLHNGQGNGDTEMGAYTLTPDGVANNTITRNVDWKWAVTSEDEWYKAAYHKNDGVTDNYWDYPTGSNTPPTAENPPGTDDVNGSANYGGDLGLGPDELTNVGAYTASDSPYGTFDQGGNAWELNDTIINVVGHDVIPDGSYRGIRSGSFNSNNNQFDLHVAWRNIVLPGESDDGENGDDDITFRVVENPQPIKPGDAADFCGLNSDQPDGYVDYWDLLYFAQRWHTRPSDTNWDPRCDLDKEDNYVDYWDLLFFAQQWHKGQKP